MFKVRFIPVANYSQVPNKRIYSFRYDCLFPDIFASFSQYWSNILGNFVSYLFIRSYSFEGRDSKA